jgi:heptaprenyl diphosphate synthase
VKTAEILALPELEAHRARVEDELHRSLAGEDPFLAEVAGHLIKAGGHRWRPTLAVLSAMVGGAEVSSAVISGACSVELVHLGSLYHDDVMDEGLTRRGVASVNARWGNLIAILAGDFLLARASEIAASLGTEVAGLLAHTIGRLCEGQVLELKGAYQTSRSEEAYFASIAGKTGSLLSASCRIGAICAGLPRDQVDALTEYGAAFGTVFQIVDDISDLVLTDEELGKPSGHDLIEGVYTLPVIRALATVTAEEELSALLGGPIGQPESNKARAMVRESGAIESAILTAQEWADRAATALDRFPDGAPKKAMADLGLALIDKLPV